MHGGLTRRQVPRILLENALWSPMKIANTRSRMGDNTSYHGTLTRSDRNPRLKSKWRAGLESRAAGIYPACRRPGPHGALGASEQKLGSYGPGRHCAPHIGIKE